MRILRPSPIQPDELEDLRLHDIARVSKNLQRRTRPRRRMKNYQTINLRSNEFRQQENLVARAKDLPASARLINLVKGKSLGQGGKLLNMPHLNA